MFTNFLLLILIYFVNHVMAKYLEIMIVNYVKFGNLGMKIVINILLAT